MATGDHIKVKRWRGLYYHHGIDMGDGTVVHYTGEPLRKKHAKVSRTSLNEFAKGHSIELVDYYDLIRQEVEKNKAEPKDKISSDNNGLFWCTSSIRKEKKLEDLAQCLGVKLEDLINRIDNHELTIKTALSEVGKKQYDILQNNCEHFAVYCKTDIAYSEQIKRFLYVIWLFEMADKVGLIKPLWRR